MTDKQIESIVRSIICTQYHCEPDAVTPEKRLADDFGGGLLDVVEVIMAVEEAFDFAIPTAVEKRLTTVGELVEYVQTRISGNSAGK